jgi:hypothetical protein
MYTSELSYVATIGLTRVATALFIANLTRHKPQVRMSYILAGISAVWLAASMLAIALRGNLSRPWATLDGTNAMVSAIRDDRPADPNLSAVGSVDCDRDYRPRPRDRPVVHVSVPGMGLANEVVETNPHPRCFRWAITVRHAAHRTPLFSPHTDLASSIAPILAGRLFLLSPGQNNDPTWTSILPGILTEAALEYALIATSITALKPFLRPFHTGAIVNSVGGAGSGLMYGSAAYKGGSHGMYMRSGSNTVDQKEEFQMTSTSQEEPLGHARGSGDGFGPRSGLDSRQVAGTMGPSRPRREDEESVESVGSEKMIIRTTKDWSVRYEERREGV